MRRTSGNNIVLLFIFILVNKVSLSQDAIITGKVKYETEVLQAATVSIGEQTKLTDSNGAFAFSVKPGTYTIIITHTGYKRIEQAIIAKAGSKNNFDFDMTPNDELEEIMLGSRTKNHHSNLNTAVPVDIYSSGRLIETGQISLTQMMNYLSPSFNTSREVLNETVTLRGLDPQHVLILINGIRYHPMAWIFSGNLRGQLGRGSVGNDLNSIPFPAIEKIEILRDGAAAQYGSDAIGGVINIILKKTISKTTVQIHTGQFYKADGEKFQLGINHGFILIKKKSPGRKQGYLNFSASYRYQQPTFRGGEYQGMIYYDTARKSPREKDSLLILDNQKALERGFNRRAAVDNAGNTKIRSAGFVINGGLPVKKNHTEIFWTIIANSRKLDRGGLFRFPRDLQQVNIALYPDGFQPRNKSNTVDMLAIAGIKGKTKTNWHWDASSNYGLNSVRNHSTNTNNVSQTILLGTNAPTSFYTGTDIFRQLTNNINFTKQCKTLNFGMGAEWRFENYHSIIGEEASWKNYDTANYPQFGQGGQENSTNKNRTVLGAYAELESEIAKHLLLSVATRYEYYSDFGNNIAGKLAARYKFSENIKIRGSINNGFRAPSLQQRYFISIGNSLASDRSLIVRGIFPNDHPVIRALAIPHLTAERSFNISGGFIARFLNRINLTADAYWLQIKNRIVASGNFDRRPNNTIDKILDLYPEFKDIMRISFFANSINTITKGIDLVLDGNWNIKNTNLDVSLAANFNSTRLFGSIKTSEKLALDLQSSNTLFDSEEITKIEKGQPGSKIILSITYKTEKAKLNIRNTRFGKTMIAPFGLPSETFTPKILTDISLTYSLKTSATITIGANNVADIYPDRLKHYANTSQGGWIYSPEASPFGYNGGYFYLSIALKL